MTDLRRNDIIVFVPATAGTVCQSTTIYLLDLIMYYLIIMDFDRLCKNILGLEPKIRFAGVC
ncbi:MAG: hypothetical protein WA631_11285, partial [Nitrososphaeraceae archaeon]